MTATALDTNAIRARAYRRYESGWYAFDRLSQEAQTDLMTVLDHNDTLAASLTAAQARVAELERDLDELRRPADCLERLEAENIQRWDAERNLDLDSPSPHDDPCGPTPCEEPPAPAPTVAATTTTTLPRLTPTQLRALEHVILCEKSGKLLLATKGTELRAIHNLEQKGVVKFIAEPYRMGWTSTDLGRAATDARTDGAK